jgi:hypothetical protein
MNKNLASFCVIEGTPEWQGYADRGYTYRHHIIKDYKLFTEEIDVDLNIGDSVAIGDYKSVIVSRTYETENKRWLYYGKDIWTSQTIKIKDGLEEINLNKLSDKI